MEAERRPLLAEEALEEDELPQQLEPLDASADGHQVLFGYRACARRAVAAWLGALLSGGLLLLLFHWKPRWRLLATHRRCALANATKLLILETYQSKCKTYHIKDVKITQVESEEQKFSYQNENYDGSSGEAQPKTEPVKIFLDDGSVREVTSYRGFRSKKVTFVWDDARRCFLRLAGMERASSCEALHQLSGHSAGMQAKIRRAYGENEIEVPVNGIFTLLVLEFFNPFYMFQVFTIAVWLAEDYYYYCIAIVIMSVFGIATTVVQTRKNQKKLRSTVQSSGLVSVLRAGAAVEVSSSQLVPGDVMLLPARGCTMHVDAVLLAGSCIVNESMLTGESVPVTKTALPRQGRLYDIKEDSSHTLYSGTRVIQTRYYNGEPVRAVVLRTGFLTTKGQLVRSIMYPLPADFKFDRDSYKFIIILSGIALLGLIYTIALKSGRQVTAADVIIKSLDILTIVVPPALPAAMTVGRLYAVARLRKADVFCINPRVINVTGSIGCVCFDKTGTLTEEGLDMWGVVPARRCGQPPEAGDGRELLDVSLLGEEAVEFRPAVRDPRALDDGDLLKVGMNVCHSLTVLDGQLTGDPLDMKMFESTGWLLEEPTVPDTSKFNLLAPTVVRSPPRGGEQSAHEWGIVHQFQFSSSLQRCSVVCRSLESPHFMAFCKGAPEVIAALSRPDTVPVGVELELRRYTSQGYRVLAVACRVLQEDLLRVTRSPREQIEQDLTFLGLVVLENRLKAQTAPVIAELNDANIKVVMITGDNLDTAVSVATECGLLRAGERLLVCEARPSKGHPPELHYSASVVSSQAPGARGGPDEAPGAGEWRVAMSGPTWRALRLHHAALLPRLVARGAVFARMTADQKQQLVQELQALGYYVAMCGDGANDCGALKAAHAGISVSAQESSVAAPFSSRAPHAQCVPRVLREGRAALVTSFGMFKFMVAYSLAEFFSVALLYYFDSNLTDFQFLFIDIALSVNFAFSFGKTEAFPGKLCKIPPGTSLLGFVPLSSIVLQLLLIVVFQMCAYLLLLNYSWYTPHVYEGDTNYLCFENYAVFSISMFQYITLAVAYSHGAPYRRCIFTNLVFMSSLIVMTAVCAYIVLDPADWLVRLLELQVAPTYDFKYILLAMAVANFALSLFFEKFVVEYLMQAKQLVPESLRGDAPKRYSHQAIEKELQNDHSWPPISDSRIKKDSVSCVDERTLLDIPYNNNDKLASAELGSNGHAPRPT